MNMKAFFLRRYVIIAMTVVLMFTLNMVVSSLAHILMKFSPEFGRGLGPAVDNMLFASFLVSAAASLLLEKKFFRKPVVIGGKPLLRWLNIAFFCVVGYIVLLRIAISH